MSHMYVPEFQICSLPDCLHILLVPHTSVCLPREDMRAEFAAAAEQRKRAGEEEEDGAPSKRSKAEQLGEDVLEVLNQVSSPKPPKVRV